MGRIEINRLSHDELEYLLLIRGAETGTVEKMRATLRSFRKFEGEGQSLLLKKYPLTFAEDQQAVLLKLGELRNLISDYDGVPQTSVHKKLWTKFEYISFRIGKMAATSEEELEDQAKLRVQVLTLEATVSSKIKVTRKVQLSQSLPLEARISDLSLQGSDSSETEDDEVPHVSTGVNMRPNTSTPIKVTPPSFVPLYKWSVKFSGEKRESVNAFLERVEDLARARRVPHSELLQSALDLLEGEALVWYRANRDSYGTWHELCDGLREEFQSPFYTEQLFEEIKRRTQGKDESIGMYLAKMSTLFSRLGASLREDTKINILLRNINPYFQAQLGQTKVTSVEHLKVLCKKLETVKASIDQFVPPPSKARSLEPELAYVELSETPHLSRMSVNQREKSMVCYKCNQSGHIARNCRQKRCYKCGKVNFTVRTCPDCNKASGNANRGQ